VGEGGCTHTVLVGILEGKRQLGRPARRWEDIIKIGFSRSGIERHGQV
jgi:hypothetical protein